VLSDIHGNIDALEAVLRHAEGTYERVVCCGDLVGYGAAPAEVIAWARESAQVIVRGNHDVAAWSEAGLRGFNPAARAAIVATRELLDGEDLRWLQDLPIGPVCEEDYQVAHGSPADEHEYLVEGWEVEPLCAVLERKVCFVGHTHIQTGWSWQRGGLQRLPRPSLTEEQRTLDIDPGYLYLINPGSVGQPRDGDARAAYALWDPEDRLLSFRRVRYNVRAAQMRIMDGGFPPVLAERLGEGR